MQKFDFLFNVGQQVFRVAFSFSMIIIPFVVKNVSLQLVLCIFDLLHFLFDFIVLLELIKFIALIVASRCLTMIGPSPQAYPTELMLASDASHVVAPLIFFYRLFTIWARFRVCHDPLHILTLCGVFLFPLHSDFTICRFVALVATEETKWATALTMLFGDGWVNTFLVT